jgi:soluble lytic murein transglycosylase-like protein
MILALLLLALPLHAAPAPAVLDAVMVIADRAGVPRSVARALMLEESGGDPLARSVRVAGYRSRGLYQLYEHPRNLNQLLYKFWFGPSNDCRLRTFDILDPRHNALVGLRYLAALHREYGTWRRALHFYNCGRVIRVPAETRRYAARIVDAE